ncbi:hypothetical protein PHYPSEUDO_015509 [Phytophthora pseudosyringae]|uniref:MARVEL domain-containing protein n=1 Tax=Phytophthora pseudosyringae TaxID=221518 RepID=A0A8T1VZM8_9STRA|nr:hypothetical protein PHYPSEUDO_015509 [Phytophthora pseudosyringae]
MASGRSCTSRFCLFWTRVMLRLVQFGASLVAYIALRTAGVSYQNTAGGQTVAVVVNSGAMNFARIINLLAFLYAFAFLVFIEWLRLCVHPVNYCEKTMDAVLLVCLTTATLVLLLSGITLHCRWQYGRFVHCGEVYLAVAMSFLSTFAFLASVLIGKRDEEGQRGPRQRQEGGRDSRESGAYSQHGSPRAGATPVPIVTAQPAYSNT